ncbi:hypothetical protein [Cellulomonas xylanilytica]|uniref:Uncharacterized protein n=1 Tax=Cellulomonas xylanilytica TaxID=233583 RepID=A0A510V769_9CELL|nr:hypothetical protein [Cellulomonas xylanilytica]GEK22712.1 hypothetical protein CXY01_32320 [Cellulomonas xylanilytica]
MGTPSHADVVAAFGPDAGHLPDGEAVGSSADDWPAVIAALGRSGWPAAPDLASVLDTEEPPTLAVHPLPAVQVNFFPAWGYVAFDIDLRELVDQPSTDAVLAVIELVGRATGRTVVLAHEGGGPESAVLSYDPSDDEHRLLPGRWA